MIIVKVGERYGKLFVTKVEGKSAWCRCECGEEIITTTSYLQYEKITSCSKCSTPKPDLEKPKLSIRKGIANQRLIDRAMKDWASCRKPERDEI